MRLLRRLRRTLKLLRRASERLAFGGPRRERFLTALLAKHYRSRFRQDWVYADEPPHFWGHRMGWFRLGFEADDGGASVYGRAFYSGEVVRAGDEVLDIGCGDGFITKRFLGERAARVDAIDIEPSAIAEAERWNAARNVRYSLLDAVAEPFPAQSYDVVVWDGAIAHFDPSSTAAMLAKIAAALKPDGVFVGSESLGPEGPDHLQRWDSLEELGSMLKPHFPIVEARERSYMIGRAGGRSIRREAYWRCALAGNRLAELGWRRQ